MHQNSELLFKKYARPYFKSRMRVLEIGPSRPESLYRAIVADPAITWESVDLSAVPGVTYVAKDAYSYPIPDNTFDIVISGQVIEHVRKIWVWTRELARVCKPGGRVITIAPASWVYHDSADSVDCWRIYPDGMRSLYDDAGLSMELCVYETQEGSSLKRIIPGAGRDRFDREGSFKFFIKKMIGWPITCSFDTIAIGTKPLS